ncbi:MAG: hypothetical protein ACYC63_18410 [Armatimonadota bacterium]
MHTPLKQKLKTILAAAMVAVMVMVPLTGAIAALCVWRNPDADIKDFYGSGSYRKIVVKVGAKKGAIEKLIGAKLDADENEMNFWPVTSNGKRVGTVASHLGKGDYGAIEVIMAIDDPANGPAKLKGIKIQRDREKHREALRSDTFLKQFNGKTAASPLKVGQDIKAAHPSAIKGSQIVALSVKKQLVAYEQLGIAGK